MTQAPPVTAPEPKDDHTFDLNSLELTKNLVEVHQEGNFLVALTDKGVRFRQHIPAGKILNKKDGEFVLEDMIVQ